MLTARETRELDQISAITWRSVGNEPAFIFDIPAGMTGFIGFFLIGSSDDLAPRICFDKGSGFDEASGTSLKRFPVAFYHIQCGAQTGRRFYFRPCIRPTIFRFIAFRTNNAFFVAILHYLFNLRYQNIGLMAPRAGVKGSLFSSIKGTVSRITKFFLGVSRGGGVRIQSSVESTLDDLVRHMSRQAEALEIDSSGSSAAPGQSPIISFVTPTYNTRVDYLDDLLLSFAVQKGSCAELVLSDDGSTDAVTLARLASASSEPGVVVLFNRDNKGIAAATNAGIAAARGTWISFIDHDDKFVPGAVAVIAHAIHRNPDAEFFYTDELITDNALRLIGAFCKPAYDSVLLSGVNYINHLSIFSRKTIAELGGLASDRDGSQDYDLLLRYLAKTAPGSVVHIPFPAYMWRRGEDTYSQVNLAKATQNARLSLTATYDAPGRPVAVVPALDANLHRISFSREASSPGVSVIIPNRNSLPLIRSVVDDLLHKTAMSSLEIVIVDNGSDDPAVLDFYDKLRRECPSIVIEIIVEPFNFAKMCNRGAALARHDRLLFLNNDIEVLEPDWLAEMIECLNFPETGIVGAKLLYPDRTIQHNGVIVGLGDAAGHWYGGQASDTPGPMGRFNVRQTMTAVTGACMLATRRCFTAVDGFDATAFPIAYNDIDFCLRARDVGFRTIWTPFACLIHHESATRGNDEVGENNIRFKIEMERLQARHRTVDYVDAAYSPFYDRHHSEPHIILPETLPATRVNRFS